MIHTTVLELPAVGTAADPDNPRRPVCSDDDRASWYTVLDYVDSSDTVVVKFGDREESSLSTLVDDYQHRYGAAESEHPNAASRAFAIVRENTDGAMEVVESDVSDEIGMLAREVPPERGPY